MQMTATRSMCARNALRAGRSSRSGLIRMDSPISCLAAVKMATGMTRWEMGDAQRLLRSRLGVLNPTPTSAASLAGR